MPQFFLPPEALAGQEFTLAGPEAFHIAKVLRCQPGQTIVLFDGKGGRFEGLIREVRQDGTVVGTLGKTLHKMSDRAAVRLHLYQGLIKASHWDWLLEKGTELGAASFTPVLTPRTVVLLREVERAKAKQERWGRVIMAAAKQCQRAELPPVNAPIEFRDAIKTCAKAGGLTLLAWEGLSGATAHESLRPALRAADHKRGDESLDVNVFIGPEGGFSEEEVELAESLGVLVFGLGPRVLRSETAALAAAALIQYELGGL